MMHCAVQWPKSPVRGLQGTVRSPRSTRRVKFKRECALVLPPTISLEWDIPVEDIVKYEGPVLAEREHIAELARRVEVSGPQTDAEYREVFGEEPADLGSMVMHRLHQLHIDAESARWNAWKLSRRPVDRHRAVRFPASRRKRRVPGLRIG